MLFYYHYHIFLQLCEMIKYFCNNKSGACFVGPQPSTFGLQQPQIRFVNPAIQECLDAVSEHQRLKALMKGEWAKGLLPQSSVRADYTVQRIRGLISSSLHHIDL